MLFQLSVSPVSVEHILLDLSRPSHAHHASQAFVLGPGIPSTDIHRTLHPLSPPDRAQSRARDGGSRFASCLHMIGKKSGTNGTAIFFLASFAGRSMLVTDLYLLCYMLRRSPSETRYHSHTAATHFARLMFLLELSTIQGCLRRSRGYGRSCASRMRLGCQAKRRGQGLRIEHTARSYH